MTTFNTVCYVIVKKVWGVELWGTPPPAAEPRSSAVKLTVHPLHRVCQDRGLLKEGYTFQFYIFCNSKECSYSTPSIIWFPHSAPCILLQRKDPSPSLTGQRYEAIGTTFPPSTLSWMSLLNFIMPEFFIYWICLQHCTDWMPASLKTGTFLRRR